MGGEILKGFFGNLDCTEMEIKFTDERKFVKNIFESGLVKSLQLGVVFALEMS